MITVCVLGSGSSGNCTYIGNGDTALLVDAGFSAKDTRRRMDEAGLDAEKICAILVTHEHLDHSKGAGVLSRALKATIFVNENTNNGIKHIIGKPHEVVRFEAGETFEAAGMGVSPFSIPHDAVDPCGFVLTTNGTKVAVATDTGYATSLMRERMHGAGWIVVEANHDPDMLTAGPYPWELKQRIASRTGHLSNEGCMELVGDLVSPDLQGVSFAHLSQQNNNPDIVAMMAREALTNGAGPLTFEIARQSGPGKVNHVE